MDDGTETEPASPTPPRAVAVILAILVFIGLLIIALSFAPWVRFEDKGAGSAAQEFSTTVDGTEIGRLVGDDYEQPADVADQLTNPCSCRSDAGDGYVTAFLGAMIVAGAALGLVWKTLVRAGTLLATVASLGVLIVAGYNAMTKWQAVGAPDLKSTFVQLSGDVTPWLYALTALAAVSAVLCGVVWTLILSMREEEDDMLEEEPLTEGLNGWA
jgi:hypothetical protein